MSKAIEKAKRIANSHWTRRTDEEGQRSEEVSILVANYALGKTAEAHDKLEKAKQEGVSKEILLKLVNNLNQWIAFLDLADTHKRFKVVDDDHGQALIEQYSLQEDEEDFRLPFPL